MDWSSFYYALILPLRSVFHAHPRNKVHLVLNVVGHAPVWCQWNWSDGPTKPYNTLLLALRGKSSVLANDELGRETFIHSLSLLLVAFNKDADEAQLAKRSTKPKGISAFDLIPRQWSGIDFKWTMKITRALEKWTHSQANASLTEHGSSLYPKVLKRVRWQKSIYALSFTSLR